MSHSSGLIVLLDANVLYPAPIRDLLLSLADIGMYQPKWSKLIQQEWMRNLLIKRPDLFESQLFTTVSAMNKAFPDANTTGFEKLIQGLDLPDLNDRHVLAAAIKSRSKIIVIFNLKDFPKKYLNEYEIKAQHPDIFISNCIQSDEIKSFNALVNQVKRLTNPVKTIEEVLSTLSNAGLVKSCTLFKQTWQNSLRQYSLILLFNFAF